MKDQASLYEEITARIVEQLEKGVVPWRRPWTANGGGLARNVATDRSYRGVNVWLLFTAAGGQTLGKMAAHLRVVDATAEEPEMVTIGQAFRRSCASVLTVATLGLGWLPGLFGDGRALHDRLAGTRVIRS